MMEHLAKCQENDGERKEGNFSRKRYKAKADSRKYPSERYHQLERKTLRERTQGKFEQDDHHPIDGQQSPIDAWTEPKCLDLEDKGRLMLKVDKGYHRRRQQEEHK